MSGLTKDHSAATDEPSRRTLDLLLDYGNRPFFVSFFAFFSFRFSFSVLPTFLALC